MSSPFPVEMPPAAADIDAATAGKPIVPREYLVPFVLLTSMFALWGLANTMTDVLLAAFKRIMSMTDFQTSWIQLSHYIAYFFLALPAALFIKRFTYKAGVLLGLGMFVLGALLFYPSSRTMEYGHFLVALFILAGGLSVLETSVNPYVVVMGPPETATRRLNLAQAFNPVGSTLGILLGKLFILSNLHEADAATRAQMSAAELEGIRQAELSAVMGPYVSIALGIMALGLLIAVVRFPRRSDTGDLSHLGATFRRLFRTRHYRAGVVAQFFYVGAQVCVWSFTIRYVMAERGLNEAAASDYFLAAVVLFSLSRFVFTGLMKYVAPHVLLWMMAVVAATLSLVVVLVGGPVGTMALVGISFCMSLMFPTIYGLGIRGLGDDTKIGASGLVMAILGGAVVTAVMGQVSDLFGIRAAYLVPVVCFAVIVHFGTRGYRSDAVPV